MIFHLKELASEGLSDRKGLSEEALQPASRGMVRNAFTRA